MNTMSDSPEVELLHLAFEAIAVAGQIATGSL
jgi:hypothetical protein